jgi:hypothetical protein
MKKCKDTILWNCISKFLFTAQNMGRVDYKKSRKFPCFHTINMFNTYAAVKSVKNKLARTEEKK